MMVYDITRLLLSLLAFIFALVALISAIHGLFSAKSKHEKKRKIKTEKNMELQAAANAAPAARAYKTVQGFSAKLNLELQNRFMPGRTAYETARNNGNLRSIIFRDADGLQKLLDEKAGTGEFVAGNKEKVNFGQPLGQYVDPVAKTKVMTTVGVIHYTAEGAYIVPARPLIGGNFNG